MLLFASHGFCSGIYLLRGVLGIETLNIAVVSFVEEPSAL